MGKKKKKKNGKNPFKFWKFRKWGDFIPKRELTRGIFHVSTGLGMWAIMHPAPIPNFVVWITALIISAMFGSFWLLRTYHPASLNFLNNAVDTYMARDVEKGKMTAAWPSYLGAFVAWCVVWKYDVRWIGALSALLFSTVDPMAKLGMRWPVRKRRFKNGKSIGGILFGYVGGLMAVVLIAVVCQLGAPLVSPPRFTILALVYAVGVLTAPLLEFFGGKWDNFLIPAGTAVAMTVAYQSLL